MLSAVLARARTLTSSTTAVCSSAAQFLKLAAHASQKQMCNTFAKFFVVALLGATLLITCHAANQYEVIVGKDNGDGFVAMQFFPQVVSVQTGDSVRFVVQGDGHTVVFYKQLVNYVDFATLVILPSGRVQGDGMVVTNETLYSSGLMLQGESYTYTFPVAGKGNFRGIHI